MRGDILTFSDTLNEGLIRGADGRNYIFNIKEWLLDNPPADNTPVKFELRSSRAFNVRPKSSTERE
jgi:hypothetical protein